MAARARAHAARDLCFPPSCRLRKPGEFKLVYASGRRLSNEFFTLSAQPNASGSARLGMSVALRTMRSAVERNRVRRLIRESFRLRRCMLPALDIVVGTRSAACGADRVQLRASLEQLWQKIAIQSARS
jgi:ribonuclease P protein component